MLTVDTESYTVDVIKLIGAYLNELDITRGDPAGANTGAEFENDVFLISAYDFRDDLPEDLALPNFWFKPLNYQVEWYKYAGRGTYSNRPLPIKDALSMLQQCISSLENSAIVKTVPPEEYFWEEEEDG